MFLPISNLYVDFALVKKLSNKLIKINIFHACFPKPCASFARLFQNFRYVSEYDTCNLNWITITQYTEKAHKFKKDKGKKALF